MPPEAGQTSRVAARGARRPDRRIRDTTLRLLHDAGPVAVTVRPWPRRQELAKSTICRRFSDREGLLSAVLTEVIGQKLAGL